MFDRFVGISENLWAQTGETLRRVNKCIANETRAEKNQGSKAEEQPHPKVRTLSGDNGVIA